MPHQLSPPPPPPSPPTPVLAPFIASSIASPIHFPGRLLPCSNSQYCFRLLSHPAPNLPQQSRPTSDTCTLPSSLHLRHSCSVNRVFVQPPAASCFAATCHEPCGANSAVHQPEQRHSACSTCVLEHRLVLDSGTVEGAMIAAMSKMSTSFLPTIKCSHCSVEIEISAMGDHVCAKGEHDITPGYEPCLT